VTRALYLLVGDPVAHSRSPRIHARAFELLGVDAVYAPCRVTDVAAAFAGLRALGAAGCNVTVPHKEAAAKLCDRLDEAASRIGAVNCVDASFTGHNTDVAGILGALRAAGCSDREGGSAVIGAAAGGDAVIVATAGGDAVIVGAGGSARAAAFALPGAAIVNRTRSRAEALAKALGGRVAEADALREARTVVHCTTVGLHDDAQPFDVEALRPDAVLVDLVYRGATGETALVKAARARGLRTVDGVSVLVHQAIASLEIWLGESDLSRLYEPLRKAALA
jgi:shikimate dehydrogenase